MIEYDLGYGERYRYEVVAARSIESQTSDAPGLYAWFLRVRIRHYSEQDCKGVSAVYSERRLRVLAKGALAERYYGQVSRRPPDRQPDQAAMRLASQALTAFAPPLYIGVADKMRRRLLQHKGALEAVLASRGSAETVTSDSEGDAEARAFGERLGPLLWREGVDSIDPLMVKVVYCNPGEEHLLKQVEYVANRSFIPPFGRR